MAWKKSSAELIARFDAALPDDPRVERRKMFGFPCGFAQGHMFTGLFEESLFVRIGETEGERLGWAAFTPMPGRPMRDYFLVPASEQGERLKEHLGRALAFVVALPAKPAKKTATKKVAARKTTRK